MSYYEFDAFIDTNQTTKRPTQEINIQIKLEATNNKILQEYQPVSPCLEFSGTDHNHQQRSV